MKDIKDLFSTDNGANNYIIVERFPEKNYTLIRRNATYEPWVVAYRFDETDSTWAQGSCFESLEKAMRFINGNSDSKYRDKVEKVEELVNDLSQTSGKIVDADEVLADTVKMVDFNFVGATEEIFRIYRETSDEKAFLDLFEIFTDIRFETYLNKCLDEITRKEDAA